MNRDRIEGMWKQVSDRLKEQWGMLSVTPAYLRGDRTSDSDATRSGVGFHQPDSPFVLVAHGAGGRWDVYAKAFDNPLASFGERQAACDYASKLASTRHASMVLIHDRQYTAAPLAPAAIRTVSSFFIRMRPS